VVGSPRRVCWFTVIVGSCSFAVARSLAYAFTRRSPRPSCEVSECDESIAGVEQTDLLGRVRALREGGATPKAIAKALGIKRSEADLMIRQIAREAAPVAAAIIGCWVSEGWSKGLSWEGHPEWREARDALQRPKSLERAMPEIVTVVVAREHRYERYSVCALLVDVQCLGVKNALGPRVIKRDELSAFLARMFDDDERPSVPTSIELVRELVFGAEAYARGLGIAPHRDLEGCREHLGLWQGPSSIAFGYHGKPLFMPGPDDDVVEIEGILAKTVGPDGFHRAEDFEKLVRREREVGGAASAATDSRTRYRAALALAERGDASQARELANALVDDDHEIELEDVDDVIDGLVRLGEHAIEPLLEVFQRTEPKRRSSVADALVALGIRDERIIETLSAAVETDPTIARLLVDCEEPWPAAIDAITQALTRRLDLLASDPDNREAFDDGVELALSLNALGAMSGSLSDRARDHLSASRFYKEAKTLRRAPGRNDACWCGSGAKYKRCHLASDERQRRMLAT
jgi:hypothetical protein